MKKQTLKVENLACARSGRLIFKGISFEISSGEILQIRGPNGAGKSSLLRLIAGLLNLSAGRIFLTGIEDETPVGAFCHYLGHQNALKSMLTVLENLEFWRSFMGNPALPPVEALNKVGLGHLEQIPAAYLSAGQAKRLSLARLLVNHRPIWLLDEPSESLDSKSKENLNELMGSHLTNGGLILAATHQPFEIESIRDLQMGDAN